MADATPPAAPPAGPLLPTPRARVQAFNADIRLTPKLSIGTATPESIYEAKFQGTIRAHQPANNPGECELELPLPPLTISLADLSITSGGNDVSDNVGRRDGKMVWRGTLAEEPTELQVTYTAVGKGLYELSIPPDGILDEFHIQLFAEGSDVRLLELSLQPTSLESYSRETTYIWDYQRLLFGQPVRLDVLGIAPIDRLGELTWLGPASVVAFGLLVGLFVHTLVDTRFDRWMLLLSLGTFAGAYPLMYFAQEYIPLTAAILLSSGLALAIIGIRSATLIGFGRTLLGVLLPGTVILAVTLSAAIYPRQQGILLTVGGLGFFIGIMLLLPKLQWDLTWPQSTTPAAPATDTQPGAQEP